MQGYVLSYQDVAADIRILTIQLPKGTPFAYRPGQYVEIMVHGEFSPRHFSIANAPRADNTIDIHVRNTGGAVSHFLCSEIREAHPVTLSNPMGNMYLRTHDRTIVMIAGGTGIAPFLAMIEQAGAIHPMHLYWGMDDAEQFYIKPHITGLSVTTCHDQYPVDAYLQNPINGADIYLSGPPVMVTESRVKLLAAGVEPSNIIHDA